MSLIDFQDVTKDFGEALVFEHVDLRIEQGQRIALVGPNGAGKSTLIKIAVGRMQPSDGTVNIPSAVHVGYLSQNLADLPGGNETALYHAAGDRAAKEKARLEQLLSEKPTGSDGYGELLKEYEAAVAEYERLGCYDIEARMRQMLFALGMKPETLETPLASLSGGERMRASLAQILLSEPDLLLLDEPTNHLDEQAIEWLEDYLRGYKGGLLVVSHDRYFLDRVATHTAELDQGTLVLRPGNYTQLLEIKRVQRELAEKERERLREEIEKQEEIAGRFIHTYKKIAAGRSRQKIAAKLRDKLEALETERREKHLVQQRGSRFVFEDAGHTSSYIASAEDLSAGFGGRVLFEHSSFRIRGGDKIGVVGPNGCGKTTLLRILTGDEEPTGGTARIGSWVKYAVMGQTVSFEDDDATLIEEIMERSDMFDRDARLYLHKFQFYGDDVYKPIAVLSGGERSRLYLACLMLEQVDLLILDEPTNHLDIASREAIEQALESFTGTVVAVSHDRYFLGRCVSKILAFEKEDGGVPHLALYERPYAQYREMKQRLAEVRAAEKAAARNQTRTADRDKKERETSSEDQRKSRAEMRRHSAELRKRLAEVENGIMEIEEEIAAAEASFGPDTKPEEYTAYSELMDRKNNLYEEYEVLLDETEELG